MQDPNEKTENGETLGGDGTTEQKTPRPVRMKWGRPVDEPTIEEPPEETPKPAAETRTEQKEIPETPPPPVSDPRMDALRERLQRRASEEASKETASPKPSVEENDAEKPRTPSPEELRVMREQEAARRRAELREREAREAELARAKRELEADRLRRDLQKKRRREAVRGFGAAILGAILEFFRSIRVTKKQLLAVALTLVLVLTATVILGNLLKGRINTSDGGETTTEAESDRETEPYHSGMAIPDINAGIVSLEGATAGTLRTEARRFSSAGVTAVSLILRDADGSLLFSARTDSALGLEPENEELLSISEILEPFFAEELYVSCLLPMRYGSDGDAYSSSVLYAYETALLAEIAEAGADEVILLDADRFLLGGEAEGGEETVTADEISALCGIAHSVRARAPETAIGITFTPEFLASRESDRYLSEIVRAFDLSLLDLRAAEEDEDLYLAVSTQVSDHLYFILRYSMRVLIPQGSAEAVTAVEVHSWQEGTLPKIEPQETVT